MAVGAAYPYQILFLRGRSECVEKYLAAPSRKVNSKSAMKMKLTGSENMSCTEPDIPSKNPRIEDITGSKGICTKIISSFKQNSL